MTATDEPIRINLDSGNIEHYRLFLRAKRLPKYRFIGRTLEVPAEYAGMLGLETPGETAAVEYEPLAGQFDYQAYVSGLSVAKRKFSIFVEPGYGKTIMEGEFIRHAARVLSKDQSALIVCPLMVVEQSMDEYRKFYGSSFPIERIKSSDLREWTTSNSHANRIGITNFEALKPDVPQGRMGALCIDECFARGTKVQVIEKSLIGVHPIVGKNIEDVRVGDRILNASGRDTVSNVHRREVQYAVKVECGEACITVSPNHPFFTQRGWIGAQDLRPGDTVLRTADAVRMVRGNVHEAILKEQVLRSIMLSEMADESAGTQSEGSHGGGACEDWGGEVPMVQGGDSNSTEGDGADHHVESYVQSGDAREGEPPIESHEPQTFRAWGEWDWFISATTDFTGCSAFKLDGGICVVFGRTDSRLSHELQARLGRQRAADRHRSGWKLSPQPQSTGREENGDAQFVRVDGIEILEPGHPELESLRDADGKLYFYDLGGTRHPSFSIVTPAGGLLVHNSSNMKSQYGKHGQQIIRLGKGLNWKLAGTGTPAPNDRIEFANHAVFMDAFPTVNSFLARFFVNRGQTQERWSLKPHALGAFYRALSHWCIFLTNPATYGFKDNAGTLPPINVHIHEVDLTAEQRSEVMDRTGDLYGTNPGGITSRSTLSQIAKGNIKGRKIATNKPEFIRNLVNSWPDKSTLIWCIYNAEQESLRKAIPAAASIDGNTSYEDRKQIISDFKAGRVKTLISKGDVLGFGLNLQVATKMIFSGLEDSYETYWQCVKRANRVGSTEPLEVHIPVTAVERPMIETVLVKALRIQADAEEQERIFKSVAVLQD